MRRLTSILLVLILTTAASAAEPEDVQKAVCKKSEKSGHCDNPSKDRRESDDVHIDRSKRTSPYSSTPYSVMSSANEASRYRTDQGWSRGGYHGYWWHGSHRSDIPTTEYSPPSK
jgi:hypothetical protein